MNHQDSRSVTTKTFSPTALALVLGLALAFPGSAALATQDPIPGVDIVVRKNPGGIAVVVPIDDSGKFSVKLGPGDYTVSTACKSGACAPNRISIDIKDYNLELKADGSTSYEFHVGKGGIELRGQTLSIDPPTGAGSNGVPGKANQPIITKDVENGETQAFRGNRPILDEPASTTVKLQQLPPNQLRGKETARAESTGVGDTTPHNKYADDFKQLNTERVEKPDDPQKPGKKHNYIGTSPYIKWTNNTGDIPNKKHDSVGSVTLVRGTAPNPNSGNESGGDGENKVWQLMQGQTGAVAADASSGEGDNLPGKKHNYKGVVTLVRGTAPNPGGEDATPKHKYADDFTQVNTKLEARTANPTSGEDTTPQNKYADDFTQLKGRVEKSVAVKAQVTALQTSSATVNRSTPVNGIGGTGGGRFTFKPTSRVADSANVDSSNRDHIDQDAQIEFKKTAVQPGGPGDAKTRISADVSTLRGTAHGPDSGDVELPGKHNYKGIVTLVKGTALNSGSGDGVPEARTFEVTVTPVNDAPSKVGDPIPEPVGPPVKVQLRNVDTGALSGTTVVATGANFPDKDGLAVTTLRKGEFTYSLPVGNYVVEIVDAAGKIIGTSASIAVSSGGIAGGTVMRSSDGKMMIFDRWGNLIATPITVEDDKFKATNYKVTNDREKMSIAAPNNSGDETPHNKYADDFTQLKGRVEKSVAVKAQITALQTSDSSTAPGTDDRDGKLPGKKAAPKPTSPGTGPHRSLTADQPIAGLNVKLGKNPGGSIEVNATLNSSGAILAAETMFSSTTDSQGNFHFEQLPAGNYVLILPDLPSQSLTVSDDGIARGTVMRGPDGSVSIFDRWGKPFTAPPPKAGDAKQDTPDQTAGSKAAESPVGFGSGNHAMGAGPGAGLGAGPGMRPPGAAMGGAGGPGPMSPMGAGPMGGSPGGAMRP